MDEENPTPLGFGAFSSLFKGYLTGDETQLYLPENVEISEGAFYGSRVTGITGHMETDEDAIQGYKLKEGVLYSRDGKTLIAYFPMKMGKTAFVQTDAAKAGVFTVPDGVETIAPYAFYGSKLTRVNLPASLKSIEHNAFTMSDMEESMLSGGGSAVIDEKAFENSLIPKEPTYDFDDIDPGDIDGSGDGGGNADAPGSDGIEPVETSTVSFESAAGGGIFNPKKFQDYLDIHDDFQNWIRRYVAFNKNNVPMTAKAMPYTSMYTGEDHYRQMTSVLNGDVFKTQQSILRSGDDYRDMYLMIDHGLFAELSRGRMPGDLVLYSGITPERVSDIAGWEEKNQSAITEELRSAIIARIGGNYTDPAIMSTSAAVDTAFSFSGGEFGSQTIVRIYGSRNALDRLGAICVDEFSTYSGEEEILFNAGAKYRILDVGTARMQNVRMDPVTGSIIGTEELDQRTYVTLQLLVNR